MLYSVTGGPRLNYEVFSTVIIVIYLQVIHDQLLSVDLDACGSHDSQQLPPALDNFQKYLMEQKADTDSKEEALRQQVAVKACLRDMYHYARVHRLHVLECIMETALSAIKRQQLHEASNVCVLIFFGCIIFLLSMTLFVLGQLLWDSDNSSYF